jgi:hypothetical protein
MYKAYFLRPNYVSEIGSAVDFIFVFEFLFVVDFFLDVEFLLVVKIPRLKKGVMPQ